MAAVPPDTDIFTTPAGVHPAGVVPNLNNPSSRAYQYYIVAGICTTLTTVFVCLRLWVRFVVIATPWWDDAAVVLALGSQATYTAFVVKSCTLGLGKHIWDISIADEIAFFQDAAYESAIMTAPAIYFTKMSLLLLYLRLFKPNRLVNTGIWIGIVFSTVYYVAAMFLYIFITDLDALTKLTYSVAVIGVVGDVYILVLPIIAVMDLHLSRGKKLRLTAVFLTGLLAVVMSFVGCVYRFTFDLADNTWTLMPIYIVNTVEVDIGIICSCLPLLASILTKSKKESWWASSFRSLRYRLFSTRRSQLSKSSHHTANAQHSIDSGEGGNRMAGGASGNYIELERGKASAHSSEGSRERPLSENQIPRTATLTREVD